jgi:hypothetical protein
MFVFSTMKHVLAFLPVMVLGLVACARMTGPITHGNFDPLRQPGSERHTGSDAGVVFPAGQFVQAAINNTAFFKTRPNGEGEADKLLTRGTSMKVVSHNESYVKVELDSGEVGFVPSVMLEDPNAAQTGPVTRPGEFQVYPPLDGSGQPFPAVRPAELPPEGAIPTVIDPDAPAMIPSDSPALMEKTGPAPLPPNGKE